MAAEAFSCTVSVVQEDCPLVRYVSLQEPPTPQLFKCYVTPEEKQYSIKVSSSITCAFCVSVDGKKLSRGMFKCRPGQAITADYFEVDEQTRCPLLFTRPPLGAPTAPGGVVGADNFGTIRIEFFAAEKKLKTDPGVHRTHRPSRRREFEQTTSADATAVTSTTGRIVKYATKLGAEIHVDPVAPKASKRHHWVIGAPLSVATFCLVTDKQGALAQPPAPVLATVTLDDPAAPNKRLRNDSMAELIEELGGHSSAGGAAALPVDQAQRRMRALRPERLIDLTPDQLRLAEPALSLAEATALLQDVVASTA
ncbi:hypothetical protein PAPYR_6043 [Paratrimastix pyriformis]|uniref:Uncharacterized protein n=1 Tax=Paratrimastix pyriformis TaxID=342808 RepID=A0ABQ8UHF7_9EUKA|nr:hypothetical protein PAPYR_6043 [Paratrimastix pyriformis]